MWVFYILRYAPFAMCCHYCALIFTFLLGKAMTTIFSILLYQRGNSVPVLEHCVSLRNAGSRRAVHTVHTYYVLHLDAPGCSVSEAIIKCRINSL